MDRDHFYITLFSNTSQDMYPDNKTAAFTIHLAQPIRLDPSEICEVALCELSYSASHQQLQLLNLNYFVNSNVLRSHSAPAYRHH